MNKIYSVLRLDQWNKAQEVYAGRIRDCKKSLKTIAEEYKKRGWKTKLYDYTLVIKPDSTIVTGKQIGRASCRERVLRLV